MDRRWILDLGLVVSDSIFMFGSRQRRGSKRDLLLVRMDGIGDFVLWLPAARAIRARYEGYHITLICESAWEDLASREKCFDEVIPVKRDRFCKDVRYRYRVLSDLRSRRFEIAIHPCYSRVRRFRDAEAIMRVVRATSKIGYDGEKVMHWQRKLSDRWYTRLIPAEDGLMSETMRNAEFMHGLGAHAFRADVARRFGGSRGEHAIRPSVDHLAGVGPYYTIVPGANSPLRKWPADRFAELAEHVYGTTGWTGVVCGGPGEEPLGRAITAAANVPIVDVVGSTSLPDLIDVIARSRMLICNETGAVHIAAAVGTPAFCVTGGGHFGRFVPYRLARPEERALPVPITSPMPCFHCDWECVHRPPPDQPAPCVARISVEDVWAEIEPFLRARYSSPTVLEAKSPPLL